MAEALKHLISPATARATADAVAQAWPPFDHAGFLGDVLARLDGLELMQRGQCIADALHQRLPRDFAESAPILKDCLPGKNDRGLSGWALLSFNQYIAAQGRGHLITALDLLKALTPHFTAEFGIRPFIAEEQDTALAIIGEWVQDPNHHVRRLASEGTRPRLPWAMRLPALVRDPLPLLPILESLIDDDEDYVRRSVANSLNDIAKDHPDLVADFVERHAEGASKNRLWLLKHASRTLVKKGHAKALANFGFAAIDGIGAHLTVAATHIDFPGMLDFQVALKNETDGRQSLLIDYAIHHRKKDGSLSPKVFKGKAITLGPGETVHVVKHHAFRAITTRVYYPGAHRLEVFVNGQSVAAADFTLAAPTAGPEAP
ncbi:DNA alkylation repair protein [Rhizobium sp. RU36D]|uniref:DNA alkylation repair protein n=1 Tax=Rhizobium sp. RU36D TaxID=1907415 RepID=UPI0009D8EF7B|nr:DNA alkylation repair protein [Rhizobium sp. RU36D]SMD02870.1 3-methyladenine DNA glycosylase AlkC [Rhizobium sp. RU36D]